MYPVTYKLDLLFPLPQAHLSKERLQAKMLGSGLLGTGGYLEDLRDSLLNILNLPYVRRKPTVGWCLTIKPERKNNASHRRDHLR